MPLLPKTKAELTMASSSPSLVVWAFLGSNVIAAALWLLTVNSLSIVSFPPDALYYFSVLPRFYWIGLSVAVVSMMIAVTVGRDKLKEHEKWLSLGVLVLYLYAVPLFSYENVRYTDPYTHMARVIFVVERGSYSTMDVTYLADFPGSFVYYAAVLLITKIPALLLMKFFPLFVVMGVAFGTYCMARSVGMGNPIVAAFFIVSVNPFPQWIHFSPQAAAFILYAIFWAILFRRDSSRKFYIVAVLLLLAMVLYSPTTSVATTVALVLWGVVGLGLRSRSSRRRQGGFDILFIALAGILTIAWLEFASPDTFSYVVTGGFSATESLEGINILGGLVLGRPSFCGLSYCTVLLFQRDFLVVYGVFVLVCLSALALSRNHFRRGESLVSPLLTTWFVATLMFLAVAVRVENTYIIRAFLYGLFPIALAVGILLGHGRPRMNRMTVRLFLNAVKIFALVLLISTPLVLTVSRYSVDAFNYIPSSGLYAADFVATQSQGQVLLFSLPDASEFRFYRTLHGGTPDLGVSSFRSSYYSPVEVVEGHLAFKKIATEPYVNAFDWYIFTNYASNFYLLHEGDPKLASAQNQTEMMIAARCNKIFTDSTVRIYQLTSSSSAGTS